MRQQIDNKSLYYEHQGSNTIYTATNTAVAVKTPLTLMFAKMYGVSQQLNTLMIETTEVIKNIE